jgi:putative phage-type endonuclease
MITEAQRVDRRNHLGSSDAPAIIGVDPWRSAADVYWSKLTDSDDAPNAAMQIGNRMEPVLLDLAEERYGPLIRNVTVSQPDLPNLQANLDALCAGTSIIEAKYVGPRGCDNWGQPETDEVPDHVAIQVQFQMACARLPKVHIPAAIVTPNGLEFRFYHVKRDDDLIGDLVTACLAFWKRHIVPKIPPTNSTPSLETLKKIRRMPASVVELPPTASEIWKARQDASEEEKAAKKRYEAWTSELLVMLGDSEAGRLPDGRLLVYALENAGDKPIEGAKVSHPELFRPTTRRILRIKRA